MVLEKAVVKFAKKASKGTSHSRCRDGNAFPRDFGTKFARQRLMTEDFWIMFLAVDDTLDDTTPPTRTLSH